MKRKRKSQNAKAVFPLSAMIDVVFLLLLFFIATFVSTKPESHLEVGQGTAGRSATGPTLDVRVLPDGYEVMGRPRTLSKVEEDLVRKVQGDPDMPVFVKVSPAALEGQVVALLDVCGKIGLRKLLIQTLK